MSQKVSLLENSYHKHALGDSFYVLTVFWKALWIYNTANNFLAIIWKNKFCFRRFRLSISEAAVASSGLHDLHFGLDPTWKDGWSVDLKQKGRKIDLSVT